MEFSSHHKCKSGITAENKRGWSQRGKKSEFDVSKYKPNMYYIYQNLATITFFPSQTLYPNLLLTLMCII